jgi:cytochrome oxidase Cu insertion factor (SCO1/SenC/PrrC family)
MKKFKIYASKIEFPEDNPEVKGRFNYTIDHTILTYLMSDTNEYITHLGANLGEHELAKQIIDKILENEKEKMKMMKV